MNKYILAIIALISLFACSGPRGDAAGIINSQRITYPEFIRSYQAHTANFQRVNQRVPNNEEKRSIFKETWENITTHVILKDYFERYQIRTSEQEVLDTLLTNIPSYLEQSPAFMIDGEFDPELYNQSLRYDKPVNLSATRRHYFEYYVPVQKLKQKMIDEDIRDKKKTGYIAEIASGTADFELIVFDPEDMKPILSDGEIEAYYQRNLERFAMKPIYSVQYMALNISPQEEDNIYTKAVVDSIHAQLNAGKSMETVIRERSEQLPGIKLEEPGFVKIGAIDPNILPTLELLSDKAYSRPLKIGSGYAIFQKLQRSKSMMSYRTLQIPPLLSQNTINSSYSQAVAAQNLAQSLGMKLAAEELELKIIEHHNLSVNDVWFNDFQVVEQVNSMLMKNKKGDFLDPLYSTLTGAWLIVQLTENQVNRVYPLSEVKDTIVPELMDTRKKQLAKEKAEQWLYQNPELKPVPSRDRFQSYKRAGIDSKYANHNLDMAFLTGIQRFQKKQKPEVTTLGEIHVILIPKAFYPARNITADTDLIRSLYSRSLDPNWFENLIQDHERKAKVRIFVSP